MMNTPTFNTIFEFRVFPKPLHTLTTKFPNRSLNLLQAYDLINDILAERKAMKCSDSRVAFLSNDLIERSSFRFHFSEILPFVLLC